jgi:hypothetical protein
MINIVAQVFFFTASIIAVILAPASPIFIIFFGLVFLIEMQVQGDKRTAEAKTILRTLRTTRSSKPPAKKTKSTS